MTQQTLSQLLDITVQKLTEVERKAGKIEADRTRLLESIQSIRRHIGDGSEINEMQAHNVRVALSWVNDIN